MTFKQYKRKKLLQIKWTLEMRDFNYIFKRKYRLFLWTCRSQICKRDLKWMYLS